MCKSTKKHSYINMLLQTKFCLTKFLYSKKALGFPDGWEMEPLWKA